ncbi:hypothetical protein BDY17DRAFT_335308 [Neohortaea acidophila]|uniref:Rhodopsin domain-containing protein n=1 Tax=Neohortaea acidophila TaxID=245834 RepID=A0A6A6PNB9_9PEZI|nr:uncharacterized protein BDY17DRAFT_335308 [Neohortaea acidophila]KAF2481598.1 hypothetical protein BDY17DRAFT_335308 [Neohortaea acidophila]
MSSGGAPPPPAPPLPGTQPPLAVITHNDQRGVLFVTGALALAATLVSLLTRAYVRAGFGQSFGRDDYALGAAYVLMIAQTIALFVAASYGLGEQSNLIAHSDGVTMQRAILATDILYIFALWTSRLSSVFFAQRLSRTTRYEWIWKVFTGVVGVLFLASLLTVSLRCDLGHAWLYINQHCTGLGALFAQLLFIILNLQMAAATKFRVIIPFAARLLLIVPLILHVLSIPDFFALTDGTRVSAFNMTRPYIYTQIILALAMITPTIPVLQPFMQATATTFGMVSGAATNAYGSNGDGSFGQHTHKEQHASRRGGSRLGNMLSMRSFRSVNGGDERDTVDEDDVRANPDPSQYSATVSHGQRARAGSNGGSTVSQQPMIRRDVQYTVSYSDARA